MTVEKVVFLDRDGVINQDSADYIKSWDEFRFIPGSLEAIAELTAAGFIQIVITNQSGINRGLVAPDQLGLMHRRMCAAAASRGGNISAVYFCPHRPDELCGCRKPKPALIQSAVADWSLDPARAFMVGDNVKDICGGNEHNL